MESKTTTRSDRPRRSAKNALDAKILITAAALTATVGGWAILAQPTEPPVAQAKPPRAESAAPVAAVGPRAQPLQPSAFQAPASPPLRVVDAPAAPVVRTRSSR